MPEHIRYERPPVREMTCEFRFPGPGWDATLPGLIYVALKDVFPRREMTRRVSITHSETEGAQEAPTRFAVEQIVQFKQPDGLGFVQLAPAMSRRLLKFSGGSVDDYATFASTSTTRPSW